MIYKFENQQTLELHYRRKGATLFDSYDEESLDKLSTLLGMKVTRAHDVEYPNTPKGKRHLKVECIANDPWRFDFWEFKGHMFTVVDVLQDEEKPDELKTKPTKTHKQIIKEIEAEERTEAYFDQMIEDSIVIYGNPDEAEIDE